MSALSFSFCSLFLFPFIKISFCVVRERHERLKALLQGFRVVLKDFFSSFFFPPSSPLQAPAIDTTRDRLVREQTASSGLDRAAGRNQAGKNWGRCLGVLYGSQPPSVLFSFSPLSLFFWFFCFALLWFLVVLNSLRCWD